MACLQSYQEKLSLTILAEFIQAQKTLFKLKRGIICILTWRLPITSSPNFSCELNSSRTYSLQKYVKNVAVTLSLQQERLIFSLLDEMKLRKQFSRV